MAAASNQKADEIRSLVLRSPDGISLAGVVAATGFGRRITSYYLHSLTKSRDIVHDKAAKVYRAPKPRQASGQNPDPPTLKPGGSTLFPKARPQGAEASPKALALMERLVAYLTSVGKPARRSELVEQCADGMRPIDVSNALVNLHRRGLVKNLGRMKGWALGAGTPAPPRRSSSKRAQAGQLLLPEVAPPPRQVRAMPTRNGAFANSYVGRQVTSIILRMQNANESGQLFTDIDFNVLERLAENVHK